MELGTGGAPQLDAQAIDGVKSEAPWPRASMMKLEIKILRRRGGFFSLLYQPFR
jgi:hypothetical protein